MTALVTETLVNLRGVIFGMEHGQHRVGGLRGRVLAAAAASARTLGFTPDVTLTGTLEEVSADAAEDLLAALSEMLSNVARHARATQVGIECHAGAELVLRVSDNGAGLPDRPTRGNGTGNLAARARGHGGSYSLIPRQPRGTTSVWTIPGRS